MKRIALAAATAALLVTQGAAAQPTYRKNTIPSVRSAQAKTGPSTMRAKPSGRAIPPKRAS